MIRITVAGEGSRIREVVCRGHAGYDDTGRDILCAAVSALMVNAANYQERFTQDDLVVEEGVGDGYLMIRINGTVSAEAGLLLKSLVLGLETIRESYDEEFVRISYEGTDIHCCYQDS